MICMSKEYVRSFEQDVKEYAKLILQKVACNQTTPEHLEHMAKEAKKHPTCAIRNGYAAAWQAYQQQNQ
jgi:hypothetical protein